MNRTELIAAVAAKAEITKADAKKAVDAVFESIEASLEAKETVALLGFGTFSISERGERKGINPATKEPITIPAKKSIKFKAGSALADKIK